MCGSVIKGRDLVGSGPWSVDLWWRHQVSGGLNRVPRLGPEKGDKTGLKRGSFGVISRTGAKGERGRRRTGVDLKGDRTGEESPVQSLR